MTWDTNKINNNKAECQVIGDMVLEGCLDFSQLVRLWRLTCFLFMVRIRGFWVSDHSRELPFYRSCSYGFSFFLKFNNPDRGLEVVPAFKKIDAFLYLLALFPGNDWGISLILSLSPPFWSLDKVIVMTFECKEILVSSLAFLLAEMPLIWLIWIGLLLTLLSIFSQNRRHYTTNRFWILPIKCGFSDKHSPTVCQLTALNLGCWTQTEFNLRKSVIIRIFPLSALRRHNTGDQCLVDWVSGWLILRSTLKARYLAMASFSDGGALGHLRLLAGGKAVRVGFTPIWIALSKSDPPRDLAIIEFCFWDFDKGGCIVQFLIYLKQLFVSTLAWGTDFDGSSVWCPPVAREMGGPLH